MALYKVKKYGFSKRSIVIQKELSHGWLVTVTLQHLEDYEKLKHLKFCTFYTDRWESFKNILIKDQHVIGKKHTTHIEQDNGIQGIFNSNSYLFLRTKKRDRHLSTL